jgi:hypothetical protein
MFRIVKQTKNSKKSLKGKKLENVDRIISVTAWQTGLIFFAKSVQEVSNDLEMPLIFKERLKNYRLLNLTDFLF